MCLSVKPNSDDVFEIVSKRQNAGKPNEANTTMAKYHQRH
jgi:hypothetical protein